MDINTQTMAGLNRTDASVAATNDGLRFYNEMTGDEGSE